MTRHVLCAQTTAVSMARQSVPKASKHSKAKSSNPGRTYTSKYRGVHQTFPTKRWEAQFRRAPSASDSFSRSSRATPQRFTPLQAHDGVGSRSKDFRSVGLNKHTFCLCELMTVWAAGQRTFALRVC